MAEITLDNTPLKTDISDAAIVAVADGDKMKHISVSDFKKKERGEINSKVSKSLVGAANGVASLGPDGKVPSSQLNFRQATFKGVWNASTNTPAIEDGDGRAGDFYVVSVAGTQNLGSGDISFKPGDQVTYNGSIWEKVPMASVDYLTPEQFGAAGDGTTDDSTAIAAFLSALDGKIGYLRGVTYKIGTLVLGDVSNFTLLGVAGLTKFLSSTSSKMIEFGNMTDIIIDGIKFESTLVEDTIDFERPMLFCFKKQITNVTIRNCEFTMPYANRAAIAFLSRWVSPFTGGIYGLRIENNYFHDIGMYAIGVGMRDYAGGDHHADRIYINNNRFENIGLNGEYGFGVTLDGIGRNSTVNNNTFHNCFDIGIENTGWNYTQFVGNRFSGFVPGRRWSPMSFSSNTMTGNYIADNATVEPSHSSVSFANVNNSQFRGNRFDCSALTTTFTNFRNCNNNVIDGDTYVSANNYAVLLQSGSGETVTGNRFMNCTFNNSAAGTNTAPVTFEGAGTTNNTLSNCRFLKGAGGFLVFKQLGATDNYANHPVSTGTNNYLSTYATISMSDADYTFNSQEDIIRYEFYRINGTLTAPRAVTIPSIKNRSAIIRNTTTQVLTITSGSGGTVAINPGEINRVISDGTNLYIVGGNVNSVNGKPGQVTLTQDDIADGVNKKRVLNGGNQDGAIVQIGTKDNFNLNILVNNIIQAFFGVGFFANNAYINKASGNNSRIDLNDTNITLSTNRADNNPCAVINQANPGGFGDILRLEKVGSILARCLDDGTWISGKHRLTALNTAPSSASDTGTAGEIRWTNGFVYLCVATNTWIRAALATW